MNVAEKMVLESFQSRFLAHVSPLDELKSKQVVELLPMHAQYTLSWREQLIAFAIAPLQTGLLKGEAEFPVPTLLFIIKSAGIMKGIAYPLLVIQGTSMFELKQFTERCNQLIVSFFPQRPLVDGSPYLSSNLFKSCTELLFRYTVENTMERLEKTQPISLLVYDIKNPTGATQ